MSSKRAKASVKSTAPRTAAKTQSKPKLTGERTLSILDAAARVLNESGESMNCKSMVEKMLAAKYWKTNGKTPAATLSSAVLREIKTKGKESRFRKKERGQFSLA